MSLLDEGHSSSKKRPVKPNPVASKNLCLLDVGEPIGGRLDLFDPVQPLTPRRIYDNTFKSTLLRNVLTPIKIKTIIAKPIYFPFSIAS